MSSLQDTNVPVTEDGQAKVLETASEYNPPHNTRGRTTLASDQGARDGGRESPQGGCSRQVIAARPVECEDVEHKSSVSPLAARAARYGDDTLCAYASDARWVEDTAGAPSPSGTPVAADPLVKLALPEVLSCSSFAGSPDAIVGTDSRELETGKKSVFLKNPLQIT